jgi:HSP20 family molecular chaperone IbpA
MMDENDIQGAIDKVRSFLDMVEDNKSEISEFSEVLSNGVSEDGLETLSNITSGNNLEEEDNVIDLSGEDGEDSTTTDLCELEVEEEQISIVMEEYTNPDSVSLEFTPSKHTFGSKAKLEVDTPSKGVSFDIPDDYMESQVSTDVNNGVMSIKIPRKDTDKDQQGER